MQSISFLSSFSLCQASFPRLTLARKSIPTLELNEENIKNFQNTSVPASSIRDQISSQEIKRFPDISHLLRKHAESGLESEQKHFYYPKILEKLEGNQLINFSQKRQKILSIIAAEKQTFLARKNNIQKYFDEIEDILINLWADIAVATDGFKDPSAYTSIELTDNEIDSWLDLKKFLNAAIKKLLCPFTTSGQLASILTNLSLNQLIDLIIEAAPVSQQPQESNQHNHTDIDHAICQEIFKRLLHSLQEAKNILSHPGLQFLGKSNLPYSQTPLAASFLNLIRRLTKTTQTLQMLTQDNETPSQADSEALSLLHSAIQSLYEQFLTDLPKYQSRLHIQALQELKQILLIPQKYSRAPLSLNQQIANCWHNLCERMAGEFHHTLISTDNAQDIIHSIHDLLLAHSELNTFSDSNAKVDSLQEFIDGSIEKLKPYQLNQLANKLASAPLNGLRNALSDALNLEVQKDQNDSDVIKYLDQYPLQLTQIQQILDCLQIPFKSGNPLSNLPYQLLNYFFAPHSLTTDYLNSIRNIFKIEISISTKKKQKVFVRVLRGDVPAATVKTIQELLQKEYRDRDENPTDGLIKNCKVAPQYITDATRGAMSNSAFNGKRVFNEPHKEEATEEARKRKSYIDASLLRNSCGSNELAGLASIYLNQTPYNHIDRILPFNEVVTLPMGKPIVALLSKSFSMEPNIISPNKNRRNSAHIEMTFERRDISLALTDGGPIPLKPKENYLRWSTTLEVAPEQNQDKNKSPVELVKQKISFEYSIED